MQFYLSEILNRPVYNKSKERIGTLDDVLVVDISKPHPVIRGLLLKRGGKKGLVFIPQHDVEALSPKSIKLTTDVVDLTPFAQSEGEVLLVNNVYDKQIVDIDDRRLTRVNDLKLEEDKNIHRLKGVDVSVAGLLKRLNLPNIGDVFKPNIVDWEDVQFLGGQGPMKFNVQYKNLESLHPVDIGRIIFEGPGYKQGSRVLASLKDPIAADIIEELSPKLQRNLIESMKLEDVADVIEHMPPDKGADLLLTLGPAYAQKILPLIKKEEVQKIQALLIYPENTTGAFMTPDYLATSAESTVEETIKLIKETEEMPDFALYVYVLENKLSNKLIGVISLDELLTADRRSRMQQVMTRRILVASPADHIKRSLKRMHRYNVSALPVVNKPDGKLLGIITFRNAITIYLPRRWKAGTRQVFSGELN